ncbi:MAG: hypothetical protein NHB32_15585 [Fischerella sp. CENA71]|nr:hypothetical protein [Fischerella sp. CENA71]
MKINWKILLLSLSLLSSLSAYLNTVIAEETNKTNLSIQSVTQQDSNFGLLATNNVRDKELQAFFNSKYNYWDASVLADFWGQSVDDAKARIGRKILWGKKDVAILEQFLLDARMKALESAQTAPNPSSYKLFRESEFRAYKDVEALAKFWGDPSPMDTKLRIERNLIMGNYETVKQALQYARR